MTTTSGPALVLIDHHAGAVRPPTLELLTLARAEREVHAFGSATASRAPWRCSGSTVRGPSTKW